jgi:hypothetical protein
MKMADNRKQSVMVLGALLGALLGLGTAYLLMTEIPQEEKNKDKRVSPGDILKVSSSASAFIRALDDIRRSL